jgi:hypothetical protein
VITSAVVTVSVDGRATGGQVPLGGALAFAPAQRLEVERAAARALVDVRQLPVESANGECEAAFQATERLVGADTKGEGEYSMLRLASSGRV